MSPAELREFTDRELAQKGELLRQLLDSSGTKPLSGVIQHVFITEDGRGVERWPDEFYGIDYMSDEQRDNS